MIKFVILSRCARSLCAGFSKRAVRCRLSVLLTQATGRRPTYLDYLFKVSYVEMHRSN